MTARTPIELPSASLPAHEFAAATWAVLGPLERVLRLDGRAAEVITTVQGVRFEPLTEARMRLLAEEGCAFHATVTDSKGSAQPDPRSLQRDHCQLLIAGAMTSPHVPEVRTLTECPLLQQDGSFVRIGLNRSPRGGVYVTPRNLTQGDLDAIAERGRTLSLAEARELLDDLLIDFPFEAVEDRENAIGALLTLLVRHLIDGPVPMVLVVANLPGVGKSLLVRALSQVAYGREVGCMQYRPDEEEFDKRLTACVFSGSQLIFLDNIVSHLRSPALAMLLTSSRYQGRVLGHTETREVEHAAVVIGTGNGCTTDLDLARRICRVSLRSLDARPHLRATFRHPDILRYAAERRAEVLAALSSMVRRWDEQGRPGSPRAIGGFGAFADVVGGILAANGYTRWMSGFERASVENEDTQALTAFGGWVVTQAPAGAPEYLFTLKPTQADAFELFEGFQSKAGRGVETAIGLRMKKRVVGRPFALGDREFVIEKAGRQYRLREYDPTGAKPVRPIREVPPEPIVEAVVSTQERMEEMVARLTAARR